MFQPVYDILNQVQHSPWKKCLFLCAILAFGPAIPALLSGGLIGFEGAEVWRSVQAYGDAFVLCAFALGDSEGVAVAEDAFFPDDTLL